MARRENRKPDDNLAQQEPGEETPSALPPLPEAAYSKDGALLPERLALPSLPPKAVEATRELKALYDEIAAFNPNLYVVTAWLKRSWQQQLGKALEKLLALLPEERPDEEAPPPAA